jgi:hypothetical protein
MNPENIDPKKDKPSASNALQTHSSPSGIDEWNDRLDENLEPERGGDEEADENAREYTDLKGSGDQSDSHNSKNLSGPSDS